MSKQIFQHLLIFDSKIQVLLLFQQEFHFHLNTNWQIEFQVFLFHQDLPTTFLKIVNIITFIFPWLPMAHFPVSNEKVTNSGAF